MSRVRWAEVSSKYTGCKYNLGGWSKEEGYDSFSVFISMLKDIGVDLPTEFKGINFTNYTKLWKESKEKSKDLIIEFVSTFAKEIPTHKKRVGDIMVLSLKLGNKRPLTGIMLADKIVTASPTLGVRALPLSFFNIIKVFRLVEV